MKKLIAILLTALCLLSACNSTEPMEESTQEKLAAIPEDAAVATLAGGCFWCIENTFDNEPGVYEAVSGYVGGSEETATYEQVASGQTEHREAIQVYFDPTVLTYERLLEIFWQQIDPTDPDGQFVDKGYQYTTAIYTHDDEQASAAQASLEVVSASDRYDKPIVTALLPFENNFYLAEEYHQDYAKKAPSRYNIYKEGSGR
jgi:peptide methionine sulfoxide reductase msrA/msrB